MTHTCLIRKCGEIEICLGNHVKNAIVYWLQHCKCEGRVGRSIGHCIQVTREREKKQIFGYRSVCALSRPVIWSSRCRIGFTQGQLLVVVFVVAHFISLIWAGWVGYQ